MTARKVCPTCGGTVAAVEDVATGRARYEDSIGGHADRHTLVVEAAEQACGSSGRDD